MSIKFKAELADFDAPFEFDGVSTFSVTVQHFMYDPGYNQVPGFPCIKHGHTS